MSIISASTTTTTAFGVTTDTTGTLVFQTGATPTTAMTLGSDQSVTFAGTQTYTGAATFTSGITVQGLTVGKGAGAVASNTAVGVSALSGSNTGAYNNVFGVSTLAANTSGQANNAFGWSTMYSNTTGESNTAFGHVTLYSNTTGSYNTAIGQNALRFNTTASNSTAVGYQAGYSNTTGAYNSFFGFGAGYSNTTGTQNTYIGENAGSAMTTGSYNTIIGAYQGNAGGLDIRTASNYIVLSDGAGNPRIWTDNGGNTSFTGGVITCLGGYTNTTASAANVNINSNGTYFRSTSALKYKQDVRDLESMDISLLRAVRYKSKCEGDDQTKDHLGLIADEAAEAGFEELVTRGVDGEVEGFQYERLTVVLLKKLQTLDVEFKAYVATHP